MAPSLPEAPFRPIQANNAALAGRCIRWTALACAVAHVAIAAAQAPAKAADIVHQVQAGDTLYLLAERYMGQSDNWRKLQKYNAIANPYLLLPGSQVRIPAHLAGVRSSFVTAVYVAGEVFYTLPGQIQPKTLAAGTQLPEGTRVVVGSNGFLRLQMADDSVIRLPAGSRAQLTRVRHQAATHIFQTFIQMESGRVDATVPPKRTRSSRFEIHTPLAVASVRGTEFGVGIQADATVTSEVTRGVVEFKSRRQGRSRVSGQAKPLRAGEGARVDVAGAISPVQTLPIAPGLSGLPGTITDADFVRLPLPHMPGIMVFDVRVARDEGMEQVVRNAMVRGETAEFAGLADGRYTVGMRAVTDIGLLGPESRQAFTVKATPVAPLFQRPSADEQISGSGVELSCTHPSGVERFRLQIARDDGFHAPVVDEAALTECRYQATLPPGLYFWRLASVRLVAGSAPDQGPYSASQRFELAPPPPDAPMLLVQGNDDVLAVHWAGVPGFRYRVQVARDEAFDALVYDKTQSEMQLELHDQAPGLYFLRIQALSVLDQAGAFSAAQRVSIASVLRSSDGSVVHDGSHNAVRRQ